MVDEQEERLKDQVPLIGFLQMYTIEIYPPTTFVVPYDIILLPSSNVHS